MENTIEKKLQALEKLQEIDSNLDGIKKVRGALPEEVRDLEDEIAGYDTRLEKFNDDLKGIEDDIANKKTAIKDGWQFIQLCGGYGHDVVPCRVVFRSIGAPLCPDGELAVTALSVIVVATVSNEAATGNFRLRYRPETPAGSPVRALSLIDPQRSPRRGDSLVRGRV